VSEQRWNQLNVAVTAVDGRPHPHRPAVPSKRVPDEISIPVHMTTWASWLTKDSQIPPLLPATTESQSINRINKYSCSK